MSAAKYRKRPVEVEAMRFNKPYSRVVEFCPDLILVRGNLGAICWGYIDTLEGRMKAELGDWIIKEPFPTDNRQFYPCKPDIFDATYEA